MGDVEPEDPRGRRAAAGRDAGPAAATRIPRPTSRRRRCRAPRSAAPSPQMDAPLEVKRGFYEPTAGVAVNLPGEAETAGRGRPRGGGRQPQLGADRPAQRRRPRARDRDRPQQPAGDVRGARLRRRVQVDRRGRVVVPALARRAVALDGRARHVAEQHAGRLGRDGRGAERRRRGDPELGRLALGRRRARPGPSRPRARTSGRGACTRSPRTRRATSAAGRRRAPASTARSTAARPGRASPPTGP